MRESQETYYGGQEPKEAMREMYRPAKVNCVREVLKGKHVLVVGDTGSGIR